MRRKAIHKGKPVIFSEKDWEQLCKRFDVRNKEKTLSMFGSRRWAIKVPCPLCKNSDTCLGCTLNKFSKRLTAGCFKIIPDILGEKALFLIGEPEISWPISRRGVSKQLSKIKQALESMEKVR